MPYIYIFCKFQHFKGDIERDDRKNGQAPKNREIVYKRGHLFIWTWSFWVFGKNVWMIACHHICPTPIHTVHKKITIQYSTFRAHITLKKNQPVELFRTRIQMRVLRSVKLFLAASRSMSTRAAALGNSAVRMSTGNWLDVRKLASVVFLGKWLS